MPSFSSKGFPEAGEIVKYSAELIAGPALVSAYDLHYGEIAPPLDFASLLFLDSGGYEASKDLDLSDFGDKRHRPRKWSRQSHESVIATWQPRIPTILISYDHPRERLSVAEQIERASGMAPGRTDVLREILLKPETEDQRYLNVERVQQNIHSLAGFNAIGVTEKEIGSSLLDRMKKHWAASNRFEQSGARHSDSRFRQPRHRNHADVFSSRRRHLRWTDVAPLRVSRWTNAL